MGESVCLNCGREMEQDWAPCPHCDWKAPETWEESQEEPEEGTTASRHAILARFRHSVDQIEVGRQRKWVQGTALLLLMAGFLGLLLWAFR